jgi:methylmalonyl-CoA/ethylmalonyl-CoA epimerase
MEAFMKAKRVEHVAIAVKDLQSAIWILRDQLGLTLEYEESLPQHKVKIAMLPVGETYLELLEGTEPDSGISKSIVEKGEGLHHICLEVDDIEAALAELRSKGVALLDERPRVGHANSLIAFLDPRSTGNFLIELAQLSHGHGVH